MSKQLTLSIKQKHFDDIKAGIKKTEIREVRPSTEKKYCILNDEREIIDIIKYDTIKFLTGEYKGTRPSIIVEVKSARLLEVLDESNQPVFYVENGEENQEIVIEYKLGKILQG